MRTRLMRITAVIAFVCLAVVSASAQSQREIFVLPTNQDDAGGLGVGVGTSTLWPVSLTSPRF